MDKRGLNLFSSQIKPFLGVHKVEKSSKISEKRKIIDQIGKKLGVKEMSDWGKITVLQVKEINSSFLWQYKNNLSDALHTLYPGLIPNLYLYKRKEIKWKGEWFINSQVQRGQWEKLENIRAFLEHVSKQLGLKKSSDWGKVRNAQFISHGGSSLLRKFRGSLLRLLKFSYPEIEWKNSWFQKHPKVFWTKEKQRHFFDDFAEKRKINNPSDWGKVTLQEIVDNRGAAILRLHNGSLFTCLQSVYKDINWKREWFPNISKHPSSFWKDIDNRKIFMEAIAEKYGIKEIKDWNRVTSALIIKNGGKSLLMKYNNSLVQLLSSIYPFHNWTQKYESFNEQYVEEFLKEFFPGEEIIRNYRHPQLLGSFLNIELDIWIPIYNLAFECHGTHHYRDTFNSNLKEQQFRDNMRRKKCKEAGITLIEIPYWWDKKKTSILSTLLHARPDLAPRIQSVKKLG